MNNFITLETKTNMVANMPIITVFDDATNIAGVDNIKYHSSMLKEAESIGKELKEPKQAYINEVNRLLQQIKSHITAQKEECGKYQISQKPAVEANLGIDIKAMKTQSNMGGRITSYEHPNAQIVDLLVFIQICLETGKGSDLLDILEINKSKLDKFCDKWKLKEFPGVIISTIIKTYNR